MLQGLPPANSPCRYSGVMPSEKGPNHLGRSGPYQVPAPVVLAAFLAVLLITVTALCKVDILSLSLDSAA